jgi:hypothetical protein
MDTDAPLQSEKLDSQAAALNARTKPERPGDRPGSDSNHQSDGPPTTNPQISEPTLNPDFTLASPPPPDSREDIQQLEREQRIKELEERLEQAAKQIERGALALERSRRV